MGDVYTLFPTPELWSLSLPHRTQIIYSHDISLIITELDLKPGDLVLESGTGSGSLTHALARAVLPSGNVFTCEFHQERCKKAKIEFQEHGLGQVINIFYRDICHECNSDNQIVNYDKLENSDPEFKIQNGFPKNTLATACVLDVPKPWLAIKSAYNSMNRQKTLRFCTFSPCIEQVQKTVVYVYKNFKHLVREMKTVEFNCKSSNVRVNKLPFADLGLDHSQNLRTPKNFSEKVANLSGFTSLVEGKAPEATIESSADSSNLPEKVQRLENQKSVASIENSEKENAQDPGTLYFNHTYTASGTKIYGHTGYLTFFSIIPDMNQEFGHLLF